MAATVPLFTVRWPNAIEGLRRIDRHSLLPHRPATAPAPVILFVYARPDHTERTLDALAANRLAAETDVHIFADAPRPGDHLHRQQPADEGVGRPAGARGATRRRSRR